CRDRRSRSTGATPPDATMASPGFSDSLSSVPSVTRSLDSDVTALARELAELGSDKRSKVFRMSWWSERMLDWAMSRPAFKTQLFRFVDVFPALDGTDDVARHLAEYFDDVEIPKMLDFGVEAADRVPFGHAIE